MPETQNDINHNANTIKDMLYLAACALHDVTPKADRLAQMNAAELYALSRFHSMTAIVAMALEAGGGALDGNKMPPALVKAWQEAKNKSIRKNVLLDAERVKLFQFCEEHHIWYMPLKGSILKDLYPKSGMRQMADNDILFDAHFQQEIKKYMTGQGYQAVSVGKGNHDVYEKPPIYNFELHTSLFGATHDEKWCAYYENVQDRLIRDDESSYGHHFSNEDFYLYMMVHACKHHKGGGTGLRSLMDCYVYIWKMGENLDWDYITTEAKKLGVAGFEQDCRNLSRKLFSDPVHFYDMELSEAEQELFADFAGSGTYGTTRNRVKKKLHAMQPEQAAIKKQTKWNYIFQRTFPDEKWFRQYVPFCDRHPWFIPFYCVFRIVRGILRRGANIEEEIKAVRNAK